MNRVELMELKESCNGDPVLIRKELEKYFDTAEGRRVLDNAPKCLLYTIDGQDVKGIETTKELAIKMLLQEVG
ncbi:MAG: hypothetical protein VR72_02995 [Clostridiaceae bacterium BRH_c20a]|nr:MAG: hypothetical protein VR72_02995 [Clostridiaceae bacterium BRH_c20a]